MLLYTSINNITTGDLLGSPARMAYKLNPFIEEVVEQNKSGFYGIVAMDFVNDTILEDNVSRTLWTTNFYRNYTISDSFGPIIMPEEEFSMEKAKITFDANGGEGSMDVKVLDTNNQILDMNGFTREGYDFVGWSRSVDDPVEYQSLDVLYVTSDANAKVPEGCERLLLTDGCEVTLYAVWKQADKPNTETPETNWQNVLKISLALGLIIITGVWLLIYKNKKSNL